MSGSNFQSERKSEMPLDSDPKSPGANSQEALNSAKDSGRSSNKISFDFYTKISVKHLLQG